MQALTTVDKAVDVLFRLRDESGPMGVTALGRALGLPKSSTHRLLSTLAARGLVERDERGRYRPGIELLALGLGVIEQEPVVAAARPVLEEEAHALGETVFLVAARAGRLVVLDKAEGPGFLRAAPRIGAEVPVHATAVGRLYLAFAPSLVPAVRAPLEAFTDRTRTDPEALAHEIDRVRESGIAQSREEWMPGLTVAAAPVIARAAMVAALAVAAPAARMDAPRCAEVSEHARAAAARVAARMQGRSS